MLEPRYYKGIYCPVITNSFKNEAVEQSYQRYSRRQRQKSLMMVNLVDLALKVGLVMIYVLTHMHAVIPSTNQIVWTAIFACLNVCVCLLSWWRSFANNHLHWAAAGTWVLLIVQGLSKQGIGFQECQNQVWYMLFVVFVPYALFPLSLHCCIALGVLSCAGHVVATIVHIMYSETEEYSACAWRLLGGNVLLCAAVNFAGLYAKSFVDCEQRKTFLETRKSKTTYDKTRVECDRQWHLIQSVIPDYLAKKMTTHMSNEAANFQQMLDDVTSGSRDVSILFADIKGFTDLSSKCSAQELVELLNSLFARFDKLASKNNCLRIKLLGDCYVCVSGLLEPLAEHAHCCVNLGLEMIHVIRDVRRQVKDITVELDMRIGVHSGEVLCAVLGRLKWQLDLWSRDVSIANHIESSGLPGRVHISSSTYKCLNRAFKVEPGAGGTRDPFLAEHHPVTYFIDSTEQSQRIRRTSATRVDSGQHSAAPTPPKLMKRSRRKCNEPVEENHWKPEMPFENYYHGDIYEVQQKTDGEDFDDIHSFIDVSAEHMSSLSLHFKEKHLEAVFLELDRETFKSNVMCCMVQWLFVVAVQTLAHYNCRNLMIALMVMTIPLTLCFMLVMLQEFPSLQRHLASFSAKVTNIRILRVMHICFFIFIISLSSTLRLYICPLPPHQPNTTSTVITNATETVFYSDIIADECHQPEYVVFTWVLCLVALTSVLKLYFLIKTLLATLNVVMYCTLIIHYYMYYPTKNTLLLPAQMLVVLCGFLVVVVTHARLLELISRLDFFWKRQARLDLIHMESVQGTNRQFLRHILPDHVVNHFLSRDWRPDNLYSQQHDEVGVLFACIANFDTCSGDALTYLRRLNALILLFDELLLQSEFKCIEKIKLTNATYMAASGLDLEQKSGEHDHEHLYALVDYAIIMNEAVRKWFSYFNLRIGISCGPLVGGVIGARKPVYDIWGNTVNEASRMESTGEIHKIQVTKYTQQLLEDIFVMEYRGEVPVKGKGLMETWWVTGNLRPPPFTYGQLIHLYAMSKRRDREVSDRSCEMRIRSSRRSRRRIFKSDADATSSRYRSSYPVHPFTELLVSMRQTQAHVHKHPMHT